MSDDVQEAENEENEERDTAILKSHVSRLMEHFDSVQVFCTRFDSENDQTISINRGDGNWFARSGQVREWLIKQDEQSRSEQRKSDED